MFVVFTDCPRTEKIKVQEYFLYIRGYWNRPLICEGCYAKFFKTPNCRSVGLEISRHTVLLPCVHLCDIILCCNMLNQASFVKVWLLGVRMCSL